MLVNLFQIRTYLKSDLLTTTLLFTLVPITSLILHKAYQLLLNLPWGLIKPVISEFLVKWPLTGSQEIWANLWASFPSFVNEMTGVGDNWRGEREEQILASALSVDYIRK